jgi:DNA-binding NarL/FixJ family response regulator
VAAGGSRARLLAQDGNATTSGDNMNTMEAVQDSAMTLKLVLADDHQIVRQGLRAILKTEPTFQLVGEAADGLETVRLTERLQPDVLVLDLMMPGLTGLEVTRQLAKRAPNTKVVILSMHSNVAYVVEALRAGAMAYVLKESGAEELVQAIRAVVAGKRYFSPPISEKTLDAYIEKAEESALDPFHTLTAREREVLQLTAEGLSGTEVSERLYISPRTVETHRANLMRKLGVRNQKELIRYALERKIVPMKP